MDRRVTEVVRSCDYRARALRHSRLLQTLEVAKTMEGRSGRTARLQAGGDQLI